MDDKALQTRMYDILKVRFNLIGHDVPMDTIKRGDGKHEYHSACT